MKEYSYGLIPYLIENDSIKVLLSSTSPKDKEWGFVKGKIENNESLEECAIREVSEEIGIKVDENDLEEMLYQKNKRKDIGLFYVNWEKYKHLNFIIDHTELYKVQWFSMSDLEKYKITVYKNQHDILCAVKTRFKSEVGNEYF